MGMRLAYITEIVLFHCALKNDECCWVLFCALHQEIL